MTDYVNPTELLQEAAQLAKRRSDLPIRDMLGRGILAGAFLGYATSLVFVVLSQGLAPIVGAILFPVGSVILVLLGLDLVTGNFALLPAGAIAGDTDPFVAGPHLGGVDPRPPLVRLILCVRSLMTAALYLSP